MTYQEDLLQAREAMAKGIVDGGSRSRHHPGYDFHGIKSHKPIQQEA